MRRVRKEKGKIIFFCFLLFLDQASKFFALKWGLAIVNQGASWNLFPFFLTNVIFLILNTCFLILLLRFRKNPYVLLILAGGLGNLTDRIFRGGVVDFVSLPAVPHFNLADVIICLGVGLLLVDLKKKKTL